MATKKNQKKSNISKAKVGNLKSFKVKPWHVLSALALFIVGGFVIAYSQAATRETPTASVLSESEILVSYQNSGGPAAVENANGQFGFPQAPRTIDITTTGTVYCMPANSAEGQTGTLSAQRLEQINRLLATRPPENLPANTDPVLASETVFYRTSSGTTASAQVPAGKNSTPGFAAVVQAAEQACREASQALKRINAPAINRSGAATTPTSNPVSELRKRLIPTAHAYVIDSYTAQVDARVSQLVNEYRNSRGIASMAEQLCLANGASGWSAIMAQAGAAFHTNLVDTNNRWCPDLAGVWTALGENVQAAPIQGRSVEDMAQFQLQLYKKSSLHNAAILNGAFNRYATRSAKNDSGTSLYNTQRFMQVPNGTTKK